MDARFHRAQGQVQRLGNLLIGQVLLMAKQDDDSVVRRERVDESYNFV